MIELDDVSVTFPARRVIALQGLTLRIAEGERVAVVGPSGSGKTTLLRSLLGAVRTTGTIRIGGRDPGRSHGEALAIRRTTGTIRQGGDLVRGLTARTNIAVGALPEWRTLDWPRILLGRMPSSLRDRIDDLAGRHGIADCLEARVESLSGGQRQRVAVCRALIGRPRLILGDEPTTGLDPVVAQAVLAAVDESPAATVIVATHDPVVMLRFDRMVALREGRIVHDGAALRDGDLARIYGTAWSTP
jgi:ABC-type phosphate/phosphonate transport system ATPase subunit